MRVRLPRLCATALLSSLLGLASTAESATDALFYREVEQAGSLYVFTSAQTYQRWRAGGSIANPIERPGWGPGGGAAVFDGEDALAIFEVRHGSPEAATAEDAGQDEARAEQERRGGVFVGWKDGRTRFQSKDALLELRNRVEVRWTETMPGDNVRLPGTGAHP